MASMARSFTDVPLTEARRVFMNLKDEGEGLPDPSQDEVVEFLTTQEFHVRHADALPPTRKAQILGQLRTALSRAWKSILPDGATFHAWKNVMSECWSRAKRKTAASIMLCSLTAVSLTGCGGSHADAAQYTAPPQAPTSTSAAVTPGPAAHQWTAMTANDPLFKTNTITGAGADKFGAAGAKDAYMAAVLFTMNQGVDGPGLAQTGNYTDADLAAAKTAMTATAFADLKLQVAKANAGDKEVRGNLGTIIGRDLVGGSGLSFRPGTEPVVSRKTFGSAGSTVFGKDLSLEFTTSTDYRLLDKAKKPITAHATRDVIYAMSHVGNKWLINGWTIKQTAASLTNG